jgi:ATP-dependent Clp protease protease subunit
MRKKEEHMLGSQYERTSQALQTSADYASRKIFLFGDIDDAAALRTVVALTVMDGSEGDITILMHTCGGHVESGWAIFDAIRAAKNSVTIVGYGAVMSMGAVILQSADLRLMAPRCRLMFHTGNVSLMGDSDSDKVISMGQEIEGIRDRFIDLFTERSHLTRSQVRELLLKETYFSAEEALANGLVDGILITPDKGPTATTKTNRKKR